jgi:hypothetical protein
MLTLKKQSITELDHKSIESMTEVELTAYATKYLSVHHKWLLPQLVAAFGSWQLVKNQGVIDVLATLKLACEHNSENTAYWRLSRVIRSSLIPSQVKSPEYSTLVPLILAGFKRMQGIKYELWRGLEHLEYVLEPRLLEAVNIDASALGNGGNFSDGGNGGNFSDLGSARLLEIRTQGLTQKSGVKAGQMKNPETTWSLTGIQDTEIAHLPKLTQTLLTQIWVAHPVHRNNLMILDPNNWDLMPEPLLPTNVFKTTEPKEMVNQINKTLINNIPNLPWK